MVAFSPDRTRVAVSERIYEWDAETGRLVFLRKLPFTRSDSSFFNYGFTPDAQNFILAAERGTITTYRISDGEMIGRFTARPPDGERLSYSGPPGLSPDVRYAVYDRDVWSVGEGRFLYRLPESVGLVRFSPDSSLISLVGTDYKARLIRASDGQEVAAFDVLHIIGQPFGGYRVTFSEDGALLFAHQPGKIEARRASDLGVAFTLPVEADDVRLSPDGRTLATFGNNSAVRIWHLGIAGWSPEPDDLPDSDYNAALSPDLTTYAAPSGGVVKVRRVSDRQAVQSFPPGSVIGFSRDGAFLLLAANVDTTNPRPVFQYTPWRVSDGRPADGEIGQPDSITALAYSPDGALLATGGPAALHLWRASDGAALRTFTGFQGPLTAITFSPDGTTVRAVGGRDLRAWDVRTGETLESASLPPDVQGYAVHSPDREFSAVYTNYNSVDLYRNRDGQRVASLLPDSYSVFPLAFTPDSQGLLISRSIYSDRKQDFIYEVRSVTDGSLLRTVARTDQTHPYETDGRTLALVTGVPDSPSALLSAYDVPTGDLLRSVPLAAAGSNPFTLDPATDRFGAKNEADRTVTVGSLREEGPLQTYAYDGSPTLRLFFSPRHDLFAGWSYAGQTPPDALYFWQEGRPDPVVRYDENVPNVRMMAFSPDGRSVAYVGGKLDLAVAALPDAGPLPGDADGSGAVDVADAVLVLRFIVGTESPTPGQTRAADLSADGRITIQDVILILSKALGLPG